MAPARPVRQHRQAGRSEPSISMSEQMISMVRTRPLGAAPTAIAPVGAATNRGAGLFE
jgi:hypothetical protein